MRPAGIIMTSGLEQENGNITDAAPANIRQLGENLEKVEELSRRLIAALSRGKPRDPALAGPGQDLYLKAGTAMWSGILADPARVYEQQIGYWTQTVKQFVEAQQALALGRIEAPEDDGAEDRRFSNPLWKTHPYFNYVRRQYQTNAEALRQAVSAMEGLKEADRRRVDYFTGQIIDLMAPTNFLATNPDALERAVETEGESLIRGLENLVRDVEENDGDLLVSLADKDAFKVGGNIATTEGAVVFRNRMMELIQTDYPAVVGQLLELMFKSPPAPQDADWLTREISSIDAASASAIFFDQTMRDYRSVLPAIDVPTLVCMGGDEKLVPVAAGQYICDQLQQAELAIFAESCHCPFLEEPEAFNQRLASFI